MPDVLLVVPHYKQSRDGLCLPTCSRMVLSYWGQDVSENQLADLLGTEIFGTPLSNVTRLQKWGYQVKVGPITLEQLKNHLLAKQPVIVRVWTAMLDYWTMDTSHVVVATGFDSQAVYLNDPAWAEYPKVVSWTSFLAAWAEFDETGVVIMKSKHNWLKNLTGIK